MHVQKHGDWEPVLRLGQGGQGDVFLACDASKAHLQLADYEDIAKFVDSIRPLNDSLDKRAGDNRLEPIAINSKLAATIARVACRVRLGALKVLRGDSAGWVRDPKNAEARFASELKTLQQLEHPNLIKLLDSNESQKWFVTPYYRLGALDQHLGLFKQRLEATLQAFRGLVDAVAHIHRLGMVHRDIKPQNIFLSDDRQLVLGDMGLVYLGDQSDDRITGTFSNLGTRDWMPPWAIGRRQDEVNARFDVYALGKILWSIVLGVPTCPVKHSSGTIASHFDGRRIAEAIDHIVGRCVVIDEGECLADADSLLELVDEAIAEASGLGHPLCLKMAAHAFSRPGEPFLFSVDWPLESPAPIATMAVNWLITHPRATGLGYQPGISQPNSPTIVQDWQNFSEFRALCEEYRRWLLTLPEPRSSDNEITCEFPAIPAKLAKYFQFAVAIDPAAEFRIYLGFGQEMKWVAYSPGSGSPVKESDGEYRIPIPELARDGAITTITRDLTRDLTTTWRQSELGPLRRLRLRGAFKLLFVRIV